MSPKWRTDSGSQAVTRAAGGRGEGGGGRGEGGGGRLTGKGVGERGQGPRQVGQDLGESRREGDVRRVEQGVQ